MPAKTTRELLEEAARSAAQARFEEARRAYLEVLHRDPAHFEALNELATIALATGFRQAALTAYRELVRSHPASAIARINLGNVLYQDGKLSEAKAEYEAALAIAPDNYAAHQGMARTLTELGSAPAAEAHWQQGFRGHAVVPQPYRGSGTGVPVLLLASARSGNVRTQAILDDRVFAVTWLYAEFHSDSEPLPPHALVFNAIGDAESCGEALARAEQLVRRTGAPLINHPTAVRATGRAENALRLSAVPGVITPRTRLIRRESAASLGGLVPPVLLRSPGYHTGQHCVRVERPQDAAAAAVALPGEELLVIEYLDARGRDGLFRKYRVMFIGGELYPLHLAIADDWKVHYFNARMEADAAARAEEARFLEGMARVLGPRAIAALHGIEAALGLDYGGIDFGIASDGSLLLFEANATMVIIAPGPDPKWDYRRQPIDRALTAARQLVVSRAGG
jgi:glutathione synthase/RimK-type ligase-like ATP-grasp enzyme